jgi:hypothetical protein
MTGMTDDGKKAGSNVGAQDSLSKKAARAVMFVLVFAVLMALSAIFLILGSEKSANAAAQSLTDISACLELPIGRGAMPPKPTEPPQVAAACLIPAHLLKL